MSYWRGRNSGLPTACSAVAGDRTAFERWAGRCAPSFDILRLITLSTRRNMLLLPRRQLLRLVARERKDVFSSVVGTKITSSKDANTFIP